MAKALYAIERSSLQLYKWNGAWGSVGATPGTPAGAASRMTHLVQYKGQLSLFARSDTGIRRADWDDDGVAWVNNAIIDVSSLRRYWSNFLPYKDKLVWVGNQGAVGSGEGGQLRLFSWDGTTFSVTAQDTNLQVGFGFSIDSEQVTQSVYEQMPLIFPFRERLALFGHCIWYRSSTAGMNCMDDCWLLDHTGAASGNNGTQLLGNTTVNAVTTMVPSIALNDVRTRGFGGGVWRDKLVMVGLDGWIKEVGLTGTNQLTRLFDFRDHPGLDISGNPLTTNQTAFTPYALADTRMSSLLQRAHPIGAKIDLNGTIATVWGFSGNDYKLFNDATGADLGVTPNAPNGTPFEVLSKGMAPVGAGHVSVVNGLHMDCRVLEDGNFIWVIIGATKTYSTQTQAEMWGLLVAKYDMVNGGTPTWIDIREFGDLKPDVGGFNAVIDPESDNLHIVWFDQGTDEYKHAVINRSTHAVSGPGTSGTPGVAFVGSATDNGMGVGHQFIAVFAPGEPTVEIDSVSYDEVFATTTILYTVHNPESESVDVTIEYHDGADDWKPCTRKGTEGESLSARSTSPTGEQHTFVHDVQADLPGFTGQLQYRVKVTE